MLQTTCSCYQQRGVAGSVAALLAHYLALLLLHHHLLLLLLGEHLPTAFLLVHFQIGDCAVSSVATIAWTFCCSTRQAADVFL